MEFIEQPGLKNVSGKHTLTAHMWGDSDKVSFLCGRVGGD
jgi:hypothetical protein